MYNFCFLHKDFDDSISNDDRTGDRAQQLRALTAVPEDLGSVPSTHMAAHNYL